jgi:N-methylhydantoinase A
LAEVADIVVATDVGGTCTDTVVFIPNTPTVLGKVLSTPPDFATGVLNSIGSAASNAGMETSELLRRTRLFIHGSTVVDNTILTRTGARVGLITTEGFEDTLLVTRGAYGRWGGLTEDRIKHPVRTERARALVEPDCIVGVPERVDYKGAVLRPLDLRAAKRAIRYLIEEKKVEAIAVSLLWSFHAPQHEQMIRQLLSEMAPNIHCTLSSDIAPVLGEYERTSTTVINAYAGQIVKDYLTSLEQLLADAGYRGPLVVMQGYGGLLPAQTAANRAIGMLECGPAAGVIGSRALGDLLDQPDVIATDMGGTTFKVSVIQKGEIEFAREPMIDRFHYAQPKIEVISLGAGGGSIISLEPGSGAPLIGPQSAGSTPGPICYGRGGHEPTLTDVFLLAGYMDPSVFLGGSMTLDVDRARSIFSKKIAEPLGLSVQDAAIGVLRIAAAQIADLVREATVERGLDPRDFVLHSFGGSCGMLVGLFAAELGVRRVVVPYTASVNCAFGLISADVVHEYSQTQLLAVPTTPESMNAIFAPMVAQAELQLAGEGFPRERMSFVWSADMRYGRQVHELTTTMQAPVPLDQQGLDRLIEDFEQLYERKFGRGSAYREAGIEITKFSLSARGLLERPHFAPSPLGGPDAQAAHRGTRPAYVLGRDAFQPVDIYDFERMAPGHAVPGPAVIHTPITTVVLQAGQFGRIDAFRNIVIDMGVGSLEQ